MPLADSNVWLALALSKHTFHNVVSDWLATHKGSGPVHFCRATQQSFLRLLTTRDVLAPYGRLPLTNEAAWSVYQGFLVDERIDWVDEPSGLEAKWMGLATKRQASPKLWADAYLAAFAMVGGYQLVTTDKGFRQFKGLDLVLIS